MFQSNLFPPPSLSVSDVTRYLRQLLESDQILRDVWVLGEISNLSRPPSGHVYFTLKDAAASLRCVIWKTSAMRIRQEVRDGMLVEAHGGIGVYETAGQYQLYVDTLRPAGEGQLYQEFLRLKARLEAEGLFDEERKRSLPELPTRIGVVTSPTGAALQDILNTLRGRYPLAEVILSPSMVQGDEAPMQLVNALERLNTLPQPPDVILLARGGGSLEDLWAFNDERVVRAVAASAIPVVSGVGHETDFTLVDFTADVRAPTPTAAAVLATPDRSELAQELRGYLSRLDSLMEGLLFSLKQDSAALLRQLGFLSPQARILNDRQRLDDYQERRMRAFWGGQQLRSACMYGLNNRLEALNPLAVLKRGYAVVQTLQGKVIQRVGQTQAGDAVDVRLVDGHLFARIENISPESDSVA